MSDSYLDFLASKALAAPVRGLENVPKLPGHLAKFQAIGVEFGARVGSWGCYYDTGLGKSRVGIAWSEIAREASNGWSLILTPLAVARQMEAEGRKLGYDIRTIRGQDEAAAGINVCNIDRLERLDVSAFGSVMLDESGVLKSYPGSVSRSLRAAVAGHRWRMAASATPAPNDSTEIAQQAEFLGVSTRAEMLVRWFINDSGDTGSWRLKGHAVEPFFDWMGGWARMAEHPRDLGDHEAAGYDLTALRIHRHRAVEPDSPITGGLFGAEQMSATTMHDVKRQTSGARADVVAALVHGDSEPWVIWCDTDYEADALRLALGDVRGGLTEVRGSMTIDIKERNLAAFAEGTARVIIGKPSSCGYGLNWQHCAAMAFVGRSFSYELWYQAVRRCWRFGQRRPVDVHLIVAEGEDAIGRVIDRKSTEHIRMRAAMVSAMARATAVRVTDRNPYNPTTAGRLPSWFTEAR